MSALDASQEDLSAKIRARSMELKNSMAQTFGKMIQTLPSMEEPLPKKLKSDTEEVRAWKNRETNRILREREVEYIEKHSELVARLASIVKRVRTACEQKDKKTEERKTIEGIYSMGDSTSKLVNAKLPRNCIQCGNDNPNNVREERGQNICLGRDGLGCGAVLVSHVTHMGTEKRVFEGEENTNHSGPVGDRLYSDSHNMQTSMMIFTDKGVSKAKLKQFQRVQMDVESKISNLEHDDHRTKEHTKSRQKKKAFDIMEVVSSSIFIHPLAVKRAKEMFALYRDIRENLEDFEATVLACLVIGFEDVAPQIHVQEEAKEKDRALETEIQKRFEEQKNNSSDSASVVKVADPAIDTLADEPMGKFTQAQVHLWLENVAESFVNKIRADSKDSVVDETNRAQTVMQLAVNAIDSAVRRDFDQQAKGSGSKASSVSIQSTSTTATGAGTSSNASGGPSKRERELAALAGGMFGSTTIAGRHRKLAASNVAAVSNRVVQNGQKTSPAVVPPIGLEETQLTPGKVLLTMNVHRVLRGTFLLPNQGGNINSLRSSGLNSLAVSRQQSSQSSEQSSVDNADGDSILRGQMSEDEVRAAEAHFREAVARRASSDSIRKVNEHVKKLEHSRLHIESLHTTDVILQQITGSQPPGSQQGSTKRPRTEPGRNNHSTAMEIDESSSSGDLIFDLEALVGGPLVTVTMASSSAALSSSASTKSADLGVVESKDGPIESDRIVVKSEGGLNDAIKDSTATITATIQATAPGQTAAVPKKKGTKRPLFVVGS